MAASGLLSRIRSGGPSRPIERFSRRSELLILRPRGRANADAGHRRYSTPLLIYCTRVAARWTAASSAWFCRRELGAPACRDWPSHSRLTDEAVEILACRSGWDRPTKLASTSGFERDGQPTPKQATALKNPGSLLS
jgi:hypothetical protein